MTIPLKGILLFLILLAGCEPEDPMKGALALKGATVFDGNGGRQQDATLIIHKGTIHAIGDNTLEIPEGAEVMDVAGKFISPGLVDAHVHFGQTGFVDGRPDAFDVRDSIPYEQLQERLQSTPNLYFEAYLRSGVTAVYDVGGFPWSIEMQGPAEENPRAPHVAAAGPLLSPVPREQLETFNTATQKQMYQLSSTDEGRKLVRQNTELGSTGIKIWQLNLQDSTFMASLRAVADEADKLGNYLIVHATTLDQAKAALDIGAKVLVHSVEDKEVDVAFLAAARKAGITYIPTLVVLRGYYNTYKAILDGDFELRDPNQVVDAHTRSLLEGASDFAHLGDTSRLRQSLPRIEQYIKYSDSIMALNLNNVYKSGVRIAVGTDAGNPGTLHGISIYNELEAMQNAGIPAADLLVMATRNGAVAMRRSGEIGTLEPGKQADLIILEKDPAADIANLRSLTHVMKGGLLMPVNEPFDQ